MSLSTDIMNLPAKLDPKHDGWDKTFFELGHRDARHAAAEIAGAREAELISAIEGLLDCISGTGEPDAVLRAREVIR
jgi:hypothetical protein